VEEGIISGGGSAYIHALADVQKVVDSLTGDAKTGAGIVKKSLEAPLRQIADNAGLEGAVVVNTLKSKERGMGFDALSEAYVNMVDAGIIDPTKVARTALQNATSVAATLLTTEAVVTDIKEPEPPMPPGGGMGMM
jgi:chaperonin GroEL